MTCEHIRMWKNLLSDKVNNPTKPVRRRDPSIYRSYLGVVTVVTKDIMVPDELAVLQTFSNCWGSEVEVFMSGACSSSMALRVVTEALLEPYSTKCWNMKRKSKNIDICIKEDDQNSISVPSAWFTYNKRNVWLVTWCLKEGNSFKWHRHMNEPRRLFLPKTAEASQYFHRSWSMNLQKLRVNNIISVGSCS